LGRCSWGGFQFNDALPLVADLLPHDGVLLVHGSPSVLFDDAVEQLLHRRGGALACSSLLLELSSLLELLLVTSFLFLFCFRFFFFFVSPLNRKINKLLILIKMFSAVGSGTLFNS
jgi:hypothetical protein